MKLVTCLNGGWVSFALTELEARKQVRRFNAYFKSLRATDKMAYYGNKKASLKNYRCICCGENKFRDYDPSTDRNIDGHTLNPVVWEEKNET